MDRQEEKLKEIDAKMDAAYVLLREAEAIADEEQIAFSFSLGYGMGGTYYPKKKADADPDSDSDWYESNEGWVSSSSQC